MTISFLLFLTLLLLPELIYWLFQLDQTPSSDVLAKRAAMLFVGFTVLLYTTRNTDNREVQYAVSVSVFTAMAGLALLGIYELIQGAVGLGIFVAVFAEITICALYLTFIRAR